MTDGVTAGSNPLSRITIASLEDIGYPEVDYSTADAFELDDLHPDCQCRRRLQNSSYQQHGHVRLLGNITMISNTTTTTTTTTTNNLSLSTKLHRYALQWGNDRLREATTKRLNAERRDLIQSQSDEKIVYVGDRGLFVLMLQGDSVYSVFVSGEN